jgi:hypothetical protein
MTCNGKNYLSIWKLFNSHEQSKEREKRRRNDLSYLYRIYVLLENSKENNSNKVLLFIVKDVVKQTNGKPDQILNKIIFF